MPSQVGYHFVEVVIIFLNSRFDRFFQLLLALDCFTSVFAMIIFFIGRRIIYQDLVTFINYFGITSRL